MNKELSKWFKNNCEDISHLYYGKIQEIIEKHEAKEDMRGRYFNRLINSIIRPMP